MTQTSPPAIISTNTNTNTTSPPPSISEAIITVDSCNELRNLTMEREVDFQIWRAFGGDGTDWRLAKLRYGNDTQMKFKYCVVKLCKDTCATITGTI